MKVLKNIFYVLSIVFGAAALVLFFTNFGKVILTDGTEIIRTGTEFAFGASYEGVKTGKSADILFCLILTASALAFSALSIKFKGSRWAAIVFSAIDAVYMLVIALRNPIYFLDAQGIAKAETVAYVGNTALFISIALFLLLASTIAYLLIADRIAVAESNGELKTIPQRIVKALRDYKGEVKKIVWPGFRSVVKNTIIVLIICLILGAFIWLIDFGLGSLLDLILGTK